MSLRRRSRAANPEMMPLTTDAYDDGCKQARMSRIKGWASKLALDEPRYIAESQRLA